MEAPTETQDFSSNYKTSSSKILTLKNVAIGAAGLVLLIFSGSLVFAYRKELFGTKEAKVSASNETFKEPADIVPPDVDDVVDDEPPSHGLPDEKNKPHNHVPPFQVDSTSDEVPEKSQTHNNATRVDPTSDVPLPAPKDSNLKLIKDPEDERVKDLADACHRGDSERIKELITQQKVDPNTFCKYKKRLYTPLVIACKNKNLDTVRTLISLNADANLKNYHRAPLLFACEVQDLGIVQVLLEAGAKVNTSDRDYWTPLHYACRDGNLDIVNELLAHGAQVNAKTRDSNGWIPLHAAAIGGHLPVVAALISSNSDVNERDVLGWTPLHYAAQKGHLEVFDYLLAHSDSDINQVNWEGQTPRDVAAPNIKEKLNKTK